MTMAEGRIWEDAQLARTLSRVSWVVLVAALVLLTRWRLPEDLRWLGPIGVVAIVGVLIFPTALGLAKSQQHAGTKPYRVVALALLAKIAAVAWVAWLVR